MDATTVAIDLAKDVFEVAIGNRAGQVLHRYRFTRARLQRFLEGQARRLRAEHAGDPLTRLFIEIDYRIRALAHRIAARLLSLGGTGTSSR